MSAKVFPPRDMFFDSADVKREYKVMGQVIASAPDIVSAEKMQKKIMEKARQVGADAVIFTGMERYRAGESSNYSETTEQKHKKTVTTGSSSTTTGEKKEIRATFIHFAS